MVRIDLNVWRRAWEIRPQTVRSGQSVNHVSGIRCKPCDRNTPSAASRHCSSQPAGCFVSRSAISPYSICVPDPMALRPCRGARYSGLRPSPLRGQCHGCYKIPPFGTGAILTHFFLFGFHEFGNIPEKTRPHSGQDRKPGVSLFPILVFSRNGVRMNPVHRRIIRQQRPAHPAVHV